MKNSMTTTIDDVALYISKGCDLHPYLSEFFDSELDYLNRMGKISLTPSEIFNRFHRKINQVA